MRKDWPQDLRGRDNNIVYGNFRQDRYTATQPKWKSRRALRVGNSEEHLAILRKLPCAACGTRKFAIHVHHLRSLEAAGFRRAGQRAPDRLGMPMCFECTESVGRAGARREVEWFKDQCEINPHALADALWAGTGWRIEGTKEIAATNPDEAELKFSRLTQLELAADGLLEADTPELKDE